MEKIKSVGMRFLRGFGAGALASMASIITAFGKDNINNLESLQVWATSLLFSAIVGGMTGGILACDKYLRME